MHHIWTERGNLDANQLKLPSQANLTLCAALNVVLLTRSLVVLRLKTCLKFKMKNRLINVIKLLAGIIIGIMLAPFIIVEIPFLWGFEYILFGYTMPFLLSMWLKFLDWLWVD